MDRVGFVDLIHVNSIKALRNLTKKSQSRLDLDEVRMSKRARSPNECRQRRRYSILASSAHTTMNCLGKAGLELGVSQASRLFGCTYSSARYRALKAADPINFHPCELGGARGKVFLPENRELIEQTVWEAVCSDPTQTLADLKEWAETALDQRGVGPQSQKSVSTSFLSNLMFSWGWRYVVKHRFSPFLSSSRSVTVVHADFALFWD